MCLFAQALRSGLKRKRETIGKKSEVGHSKPPPQRPHATPTTYEAAEAPTVRACLPASRAVALPLAEDLAKKTKPQLVEEAKKLHVKHSGKSKGELLAALLERLARRDPPLG